MSTLTAMLNDFAVSIFGCVLAASFCNIFRDRKKTGIFWGSMAVILLVQSAIYTVGDAEFIRNIYPLIVHLPLILLLYALTRRPLWSMVSVFTAYLCCQLRRWIALLVVALFSGGSMMQDIVEIVVTVPILCFLLLLVTPAILNLSDRSAKFTLQFGIIPMIYYVFDYATVVYTDFLTSGSPVVVEFMPLVCCVGYLVFVLYYSSAEQKRNQLKQVQDSLDIQLKQSVREIAALRLSEDQARRYRHDLRHHLQYLSNCIENGKIAQAQEYIADINREIETQKVKRYCENETVNLILSSFAGRAGKNGIYMKMKGILPPVLLVTEQDLCVVISNALENAIHACEPFVREGKKCDIDVEFYEKNKHFFLQVINPYRGEIHFEKGIPVSDREGHGIGVQSICAIAQKYLGVCSFHTKDGSFIFRIYL